jgi:hypothetical protein
VRTKFDIYFLALLAKGNVSYMYYQQLGRCQSVVRRPSVNFSHFNLLMYPNKIQFIWPSGFRGEDFLETGQLETRIACSGHVCFTGRDEMNFIEDFT